MEIASFSTSYKTVLTNFKIDPDNGSFKEVLLISRVDDEMKDGK